MLALLIIHRNQRIAIEERNRYLILSHTLLLFVRHFKTTAFGIGSLIRFISTCNNLFKCPFRKL